MKTTRKILSLTLALILCFSCFGGAFAAESSEWNKWWAESETEISSGVTLFPGSDETERYIAWYGDSETGKVVLAKQGKKIEFEATGKKTPQGDYRLGTVITDLTDGEYTYKCLSEGYESEEYAFTVDTGKDFTALYMTDIHVSDDKFEENSLRETSEKWNRVLETAESKIADSGKSLDLILSAGDQASSGRRGEYEALVSPEYIREIPFAPTVGNHDRKNIDYKYFTFTPNEGDLKYKSYVATDWYFTKGDALFLMLDSCNSSMKDHYKFIKNAVETVEGEKWIIATFHHDLYGGREPSRDTENALLRLLWTGIFDEFGVDICLTGHSHYHTMSNVVYGDKTVESIEGKDSITNPAGTIYFASASVNNPEEIIGGEPLGEHVGHSYLTEEPIYNIFDFSGDNLIIKSYTLDSDELVDSLTITKTTNEGGHTYKNSKAILKPLIFFVSRIVNIINNFGPYEEYKEQGHEIPFFEAIIGS